MAMKDWKKGTHAIHGVGYFHKTNGVFIHIQNYTGLTYAPFVVLIDNVTKGTFKTKAEAVKFITKYMKGN